MVATIDLHAVYFVLFYLFVVCIFPKENKIMMSFALTIML